MCPDHAAQRLDRELLKTRDPCKRISDLLLGHIRKRATAQPLRVGAELLGSTLQRASCGAIHRLAGALLGCLDLCFGGVESVWIGRTLWTKVGDRIERWIGVAESLCTFEECLLATTELGLAFVGHRCAIARGDSRQE